MSKTHASDNFVAYIAAAVVIGLLSVLVFYGNHIWSTPDQVRHHIGYVKFGPLRVETQRFSLKVSLAVQTSSDDSAWATDNRELLGVIFSKVLADIDADAIKAPQSMQTLEEALKKGCNTVMSTNKVQAVRLTDFVFRAH